MGHNTHCETKTKKFKAVGRSGVDLIHREKVDGELREPHLGQKTNWNKSRRSGDRYKGKALWTNLG